MNLHRYTSEDAEAIESALMRIRWPILVTSVLDVALLARLKAAYNPFIVYRDVVDGSDADNKSVDPHELARHTIDTVNAAGARHVIDAVQGYNEVMVNTNAREQAQREYAYMADVQAAGLPCLAATIPVGNVGPEQITSPEVAPLVRDCAWFGYGGYVRPGASDLDGPQTPWFLRRPADMWADALEAAGIMSRKAFLAKVILRESGTYYGWKQDCTAGTYGRLLTDIDRWSKSVGIAYTSPYTLAAYPPWIDTFEFLHDEPVLAELERYVTEELSAPHPVQEETADMAVSFEGDFVRLADDLRSRGVDPGQPLHPLRYNAFRQPDGTYADGGDQAYQHTTTGLMISTRDDEGNWHSGFTPFA